MSADAFSRPDNEPADSASAAADQIVAEQSWVWDRSLVGYAGLARFASVAALEGLALLDRDAYVALVPSESVAADGADPVVAVVAHLYEALRDRRYPYNPAWTLGGQQRIREPRAIQQGSATCLDLALLMGAMCKAASLRPFIAVLEGYGDQPGHSLIVVDLRSQAADPARPASPAQPAREVDWGVWQVGNSAPVLLRDGVMAVEVTAACRNRNVSFAEACRLGTASLEQGGYENVHLIDVLAAQRASVAGRTGAPEEVPPAVRRPAVYPNLPPMPHFVDYPSRAALEAELRGGTGTVVIWGDSGTGKSMLAHHVAATVDHGCGWFLDASSERVLTMALATAEAREAGRDPSSVDGAEAKSLAVNARNRLHGAAGPWAVVLDNANLRPDELSALRPRPDGNRGQLLMITTTDRAWAEHADRFVCLSPLAREEVQGDLDPSAPLDALGGRPLLVSASRRFRAATGRWWWNTEPVSGDDPAGQAPARFWAAVDAELRGFSLAQTAAWAVSWLPPARLPVSVVGDVVGHQEFAAPIARLRDLGLVDVEAGAITMHRLFREAVRVDALARAETEQTPLIHAILTTKSASDVLETAADLESAHEMGDQLAAWPDLNMAITGLHRLARLFERLETAESSAGWYQRMLDRMDGPAAQEHQLAVIDALRGRARARMRAVGNMGREQRLREIDEAIEWTIRAGDLCATGTGRTFEVAASQVKAMRGLLLRKKADGERASPEVQLRLLREAEQLLRESAAERRHLVEDLDNSPDVDRSQYNLAGLEVGLARRDAAENAARHLDEADRHYTEILQTRRTRYRTDEMEEVVCCINGQAIVAYYRAMLLELPLTARAAHLRLAADSAHEATLIRQRLTGNVDDINTAKSVALAAKIALARLRVAQAAGIKSDRDEKSIDEYREERDWIFPGGS
jgi:hypothetical protein